MKFILKNPDAWNLYKEVQDPATWPAHLPLPGMEIFTMTDAEFAAWVVEEKRKDVAAGKVGWLPAPVTPLQIRRALRASGLRDSVEAAAQTAGPEVMDAWDYALEIRRDNPLLVSMAAQLGMTGDQLDDLFSLASTFS